MNSALSNSRPAAPSTRAASHRDLDAERLADLMLALTDGLSARLLHTPLRSPQHDELLAALDLALHELLVPR